MAFISILIYFTTPVQFMVDTTSIHPPLSAVINFLSSPDSTKSPRSGMSRSTGLLSGLTTFDGEGFGKALTRGDALDTAGCPF